ncbi:2-dehydro-3-deoxygalactonokinase [Actibacterium ureilyticum]|uniref:2-dehydro-3-deoxygalactonokinase n=1 Tax=Actibacterium ureilyticum TaxID=1590614 RepID=UPI001595B3B9|nr:2-dehydro-3-deoxygalactonokinase [Actibacterium ureilyticum]
MTLENLAWIGAAYRNNSFRLWAVDGAGKVLKTATAPGRGVADLARAVSGMGAAAHVPVITSGLPGDSYRKTPCTPLPDTLLVVMSDGINRAVIPGLAQDAPAHLTRGPETLIAGFLALNPDFDGVICLPGEITTWAQISAAEVVSIVTFVTTEIARDQAANLGLTTATYHQDDFLQSVSDTLSQPERMTARLASIRAEGLQHNLPEANARARLWGALVGAELAATRPYWLGQQVALIGVGPETVFYKAALDGQGLAVTTTDADMMLLKGFAGAYMRLRN